MSCCCDKLGTKILRVPISDTCRFITECMVAVGTNKKSALQHANMLTQADRMGHVDHGMNRLVYYLHDIATGVCCPNNTPMLLKENVSTAWVDAQNCLGSTSSEYCMGIAIEKAKCSGLGWVTSKSSNHNGMIGLWGLQAAREGLIGMAFSNTSPFMVPTRSKTAAIGTNPLTVVVDAGENSMFLLDMCTTTSSYGKILMKAAKGEKLPPAWALGPDGNETDDALVAAKSRLLQPLGGGERNSGYKGYGLGGFVEVLCGISAGASYGHHVRSWDDVKNPQCANLGHCFAALDPCTLAPGFHERMLDCMQYWRKQESADPKQPVLAPGDKERLYAAEIDKLDSLPYMKAQLTNWEKLAQKLQNIFRHRSFSIFATMGRVATKEALRFMYDCLRAVGVNESPAKQMSELLLQADKTGHDSHGLNRLEWYLNDVIRGLCTPNEIPQILKQSCSTAVVDAKNVLGATSGHFCMDLAMDMAKKTGVGWVAAKGCNHYGIAGHWAMKAAKEGYIGMTFSDASPYMAPTRSKKASLGTNPLSVVAPGTEGEFFYLEMATTAVAVGNIEMSRRRGVKMPAGWALGPDGKETLDPEVAMKTRLLMPLGGGEESCGYKGYGLAAVVEMFTGVSSGSNYSYKIRKWGGEGKEPANLGHCFAVVDPSNFAPGFKERVTDVLRYWRTLTPIDPKRPVLAPGDIEWIKMRELEKLDTLPYVENQIKSSAEWAKKLKIKPMEVVLNKK